MRKCLALVVLLSFLLLVATGGNQAASAAPPPGPPPPATPRSARRLKPTATPLPTNLPKPTEPDFKISQTELVDFTTAVEIPGAAAHAVILLGAWVDVGAPETDEFTYPGYDGGTYEASFAQDIQPLFIEEDLWYPGAPACTSCHHANLENAHHEMDLSSYAGIMAGADRLSSPPGVPILGQSASGATDVNWETATLRSRLRDNRMPPGMPFDITEANRDGPTIAVNGEELPAVDLIAAWIAAGVPETAPFGDYEATFAENVLPLFTLPEMWYPGSPSCSSCHHANLENAYHEMDLSSYAGILAGADRLSSPPGVPVLGQHDSGAFDVNWDTATLRNRLRNNRMPPGMPFDVTEANRDGPLVFHGVAVDGVSKVAAAGPQLATGDCHITAVPLLAAWVDAGAPETTFPFITRENEQCVGEFAQDVLPLFTQEDIWYPGAPACTSCHHANLENAYHEMDLSSYAGIMAGADRLSSPPGVPVLGQSASGATDFDWEASTLRSRLRDNRMPPGMPFDISEANRDGPTIAVNGEELPAVMLVNAWVAAGAPERATFGDYKATFAKDVLPLFTVPEVWYPGAPSCSSCHHANLENAYHEMDLSSYAGILAGADRLSSPPGVPLLGQHDSGAFDVNWDTATLRNRLRNNRMPPGMPFDISEANRDGPLVQVGYVEGKARGASITGANIDLSQPPEIATVNALVDRGGCKACHLIPTLDATAGTLGPPWCVLTQEVKAGKRDLAFIYQSIVSPNAVITENYPPNLMPGTFSTLFTEAELNTLIAFIATQECDEEEPGQEEHHD